MPRIVATKSAAKKQVAVSLNKSVPAPITLDELNPFLTCQLCAGYLVNAHTLTECSHAFCKSCLYNYSRQMILSDRPLACPVCGITQQLFHTVMHGVKKDTLLQSLVYKLVPGLITKEVQRRKEFAGKLQETSENGANGNNSKVRSLSLSLEHVDRSVSSTLNRSDSPIVSNNDSPASKTDSPAKSSFGRIYLRCPPEMTVLQLKKFITIRFSLSLCSDISLLSLSDEVMHDSLSLGEIAFLLDYNEEFAPLRLFFSVVEIKAQIKKRAHTTSPQRQHSSPQTPASRPNRRPRIAIVQKDSSSSSSSSSTSSSSSSDSSDNQDSSSNESASSIEGERRESISKLDDSPKPPAETTLSSSQQVVNKPATPSTSQYLVSSDPERPKLVLRRVSVDTFAQQALSSTEQQQPQSVGSNDPEKTTPTNDDAASN